MRVMGATIPKKMKGDESDSEKYFQLSFHSTGYFRDPGSPNVRGWLGFPITSESKWNHSQKVSQETNSAYIQESASLQVFFDSKKRLVYFAHFFSGNKNRPQESSIFQRIKGSNPIPKVIGRWFGILGSIRFRRREEIFQGPVFVMWNGSRKMSKISESMDPKFLNLYIYLHVIISYGKCVGNVAYIECLGIITPRPPVGCENVPSMKIQPTSYQKVPQLTITMVKLPITSS